MFIAFLKLKVVMLLAAPGYANVENWTSELAQVSPPKINQADFCCRERNNLLLVRKV